MLRTPSLDGRVAKASKRLSLRRHLETDLHLLLVTNLLLHPPRMSLLRHLLLAISLPHLRVANLPRLLEAGHHHLLRRNLLHRQ